MYVAIYGMQYTVRQLCEQGMRGHHHLVSTETLRAGLTEPNLTMGAMDPQILREVETLLDSIEGAADLVLQRRRIAAAPRPVQAAFVHLYVDVLFRYLGQTEVVH